MTRRWFFLVLLNSSQAEADRQGPEDHQVLRGCWYWQGASVDQALVHLGGHPGRQGAGEGPRHPLQPHSALLVRTGGRLR